MVAGGDDKCKVHVVYLMIRRWMQKVFFSEMLLIASSYSDYLPPIATNHIVPIRGVLSTARPARRAGQALVKVAMLAKP